MSNIIIASSKEEKEKLLNIRIEQIKKKNAELLNKHKLIEEDKRQAELQGRTIKNIKPSIDENNEVNNKRKTSPSKVGRSEDKPKGNTIPVEPAYNFLFDKLRDGPNEKEARREKTRRHPRNYGGINFEDVPKKIQQERAKQINHQHYCKSDEVDYTMVTTGKERREMDEWRKEREEIDKRRMQRQRKEDGGWKREWDQNKEPLEGLDHFSRSSSGDERYFPKMWTNKGPVGSQRHYNKIYHQKRKVKRNVSDPSCSFNERCINKSPQDSSKPDTTEHRFSSAPPPSEDVDRGIKRQSRNDLWRTRKTGSPRRHRGKTGFDESTKTNVEPVVPGDEDKFVSEGDHAPSPRKTVRFVEAAFERSNEARDERQEPVRGDSRQPPFTRTARNFIGSGRFSGGQKFRPRGHRYGRDFDAKSPDRPRRGRYGNQIRKVYLDEAMCKTVEVVVNPRQDSDDCLPPRNDANNPRKDFHSNSDAEKSLKSDEKKSDDDDEYEDDEDEQWEDIDEEVCLELNHGRDETNLNESSESLDQFIINNTLTLDPSESLSNNAKTLQMSQPGLDLLDMGNSSMGPRGGYPNVLDWEDDAESISHLSDVEKCNASESSVESNDSGNVKTADDVQSADRVSKAESEEDSNKFDAEKKASIDSSRCVDESNVYENNVNENNVAESNVDENIVDENKVDENKVDENNVDENNVDENNVDENNVDENNVGESSVDEKNILIENTSDVSKGL